MKKILFAVVAVLLLLSCQSNEDKANKLIDEWMSANKPAASYVKVALVDPLSFMFEDQQRLDSLKVMLDSATTYQELQFNKDALNPALASYGDKITSMIDGVNDKLREIASEHLYKMQEEINDFEDAHRATYKGEKGYKARLSYSNEGKTEVIVFYFNEKIDAIENVVIKED